MRENIKIKNRTIELEQSENELGRTKKKRKERTSKNLRIVEAICLRRRRNHIDVTFGFQDLIREFARHVCVPRRDVHFLP